MGVEREPRGPEKPHHGYSIVKRLRDAALENLAKKELSASVKFQGKIPRRERSELAGEYLARCASTLPV